MSMLCEHTALRVLPDNLKLEVKEEADETTARAGSRIEEAYSCCVCLANCSTKTEMLKHYR